VPGVDGQLFGLVHNVDGRELFYQRLGEVVRARGNGGLINLESGEVIDLLLSSPHSVQRMGDGYMILDSGHAELLQYDETWHLCGRVPVTAWGRGAAQSRDGQWLFVGISPIRKRYFGRIPGVREGIGASVDLLAVNSGATVSSLAVPHAEEIYSVNLVGRSEALSLLEIGCHSTSTAAGRR